MFKTKKSVIVFHLYNQCVGEMMKITADLKAFEQAIESGKRVECLDNGTWKIEGFFRRKNRRGA